MHTPPNPLKNINDEICFSSKYDKILILVFQVKRGRTCQDQDESERRKPLVQDWEFKKIRKPIVEDCENVATKIYSCSINQTFQHFK